MSSTLGYTEFEGFRVSKPHEYVAHVEIDRQKKYNSFTHDMFHSMPSLFDRLSHDPDVRAILLSGMGEKAFSAGLDVSGASSSGPVGTPAEHEDFARRTWKIRRHALDYQNAINAIERCEKPVICLLHGISYGAAIDIATAADVRYCTRDVSFCIREIDVGLAPDIGTMSRLPKIGVSYSWAKEVVYTAVAFRGDEALSYGFVNKVFETKADLVAGGLALAETIASKSPVAVQSAKALWDFSRDRPVQDGLLYTAAWNGAMVQADDVKKAMLSGIRKTKTTFEKL
ncbi:Delta(3,5)-Delta(2,4)-dienoyl-CoA isomerase, mitochondrial [Fulvia fulva]|uniref:Delta(3,5)-Delta(2,4)-dienoyl-CoA isomerase, mitochondrial n=1 Tax=Passalora fulva TaxID=5499 RepID=A0A9Q8UR87_PASFU|nr:Delta(3,5)-Delta(2,4)-dienoyl-CoA isomerase, mitochondrial [Fulvia fulva]KAK4621913.1 Delta(3,5)-Delta(2,4)-dienoyl-CoA isomerase, mitochondrial [Fulvia fulva]KAK4622835.1 Delta(3,5)-Delta(2,4)-dienoyl-CoA isomerase, mitochondrial [Fulvia fulva]UJO19465.1 Delta(3,5)-Delta(2,4)-dienoyl-CoA isomerase, mitochondrial [Fulvia fulva]WPV16118.1 Delta(3,5)-Delta(2,4)-dienoyl-CoA isomerase, mitochondrial [Fulvia fulva]WPV31614.1 Delta(3,5)-Delta(2,4)-dienoyl-CoA isomerase, mitochondrial [Fulvia fulv